ncbi:MAG: tRNA epoxyqueuosine(34) reductase QueG [Chloroflexi bacterium]|nr:tRNA epoxyqueuosine(34) reductase QueG [Chloroflexota bacterium]
MSVLKRALKERAAELGLHLVGIASAEPCEGAQARTLAWLERGYQAEMGWMNEQRARLACQPEQLLPGARSVISVGVSYLAEAPEPEAGVLVGRVARYAWGDDYHEVLRERLGRLVDFLEQRLGARPRARVFVDSSPFPEREAAVRAGLGFYGKNTNLLTGLLGSFLFLGAILTDAELEPDQPPARDCGQCRLCLDACPTGALVAPYQLDARRCIAYLTIELRGSISWELRPVLGDHVFGCDICQEVCPWNRRVRPLAWPEFQPRPGAGARPELIPLLALDAAGFRARFRRSPMRRARRAGLLRNVAVALGNSGDRRAVPPLIGALQDPDALVREHAAWALERLRGVQI